MTQEEFHLKRRAQRSRGSDWVSSDEDEGQNGIREQIANIRLWTNDYNRSSNKRLRELRRQETVIEQTCRDAAQVAARFTEGTHLRNLEQCRLESYTRPRYLNQITHRLHDYCDRERDVDRVSN